MKNVIEGLLSFIIPFFNDCQYPRDLIGLIEKHNTLKQYEVTEAAGYSTGLIKAGISEVDERKNGIRSQDYQLS